MEGFDWENFGILYWFSLMRGGYRWRFDCIMTNFCFDVGAYN